MWDVVTYVVLGFVEGLTEFIPVSSSGHLILVRSFFNLATGDDLAIDAVLQLATACALLVYFWRDILNLAYTALYLVVRKPARTEDVRLLVAIIVGTVPAVVLGLLFEHAMETIFRSATLVAYALIAGSIVMIGADYAMTRVSTRVPSGITWWNGIVVGLFQSLALIPGMSRSGMTIAGGMFLGFSRSDAARFGFLLSVPILFGSGLKKLYELDASGALSSAGMPLFAGVVVAFLTGLASIAVLMAVVRKTPLAVFALYRVALAVVILVLLHG